MWSFKELLVYLEYNRENKNDIFVEIKRLKKISVNIYCRVTNRSPRLDGNRGWAQ